MIAQFQRKLRRLAASFVSTAAARVDLIQRRNSPSQPSEIGASSRKTLHCLSISNLTFEQSSTEIEICDHGSALTFAKSAAVPDWHVSVASAVRERNKRH
jgi:hypothetical protein